MKKILGIYIALILVTIFSCENHMDLTPIDLSEGVTRFLPKQEVSISLNGRSYVFSDLEISGKLNLRSGQLNAGGVLYINGDLTQEFQIGISPEVLKNTNVSKGLNYFTFQNILKENEEVIITDVQENGRKMEGRLYTEIGYVDFDIDRSNDAHLKTQDVLDEGHMVEVVSMGIIVNKVFENAVNQWMNKQGVGHTMSKNHLECITYYQIDFQGDVYSVNFR